MLPRWSRASRAARFFVSREGIFDLEHKFDVGQIVVLALGSSWGPTVGDYVIRHLIPPSDSDADNARYQKFRGRPRSDCSAKRSDAIVKILLAKAVPDVRDFVSPATFGTRRDSFKGRMLALPCCPKRNSIGESNFLRSRYQPYKLLNRGRDYCAITVERSF